MRGESFSIESLHAFFGGEWPSEEELATLVSAARSSLTEDEWVEACGRLTRELLPIGQLLPEVYAEWRPIVEASLAYVLAHLSLSRLAPKLLEQLRRRDEALEKRIVSFVAEMPTLQKLGQIVARNQNLDALFRAELERLENSIRDVEPETIFATIREALRERLEAMGVEFEEVIHAEASVSAVVRFSFWDEEREQRSEGVFKVLKPGIAGYFWEEISLLDGLVGHLERQYEDHLLGAADLHEIIDEIREHLTPELDFRNEQAHLVEARSYFLGVMNLRIPELISGLSTDVITAMSYEAGVKVSDAAGSGCERVDLARRMIDALLARPLLDPAATSLLHADPHAGNIFADESTGDLVLLDWSLVERLPLADRRQILRVVAGMSLRDPGIVADALCSLSGGESEALDAEHALIEQEVGKAMVKLPVFAMPDLVSMTELVDALALKGVSFGKPLLVFRKALLTLEGVLQDLAPEIDIGVGLLGGFVAEEARRMLETPFSAASVAPLRGMDLLELARAFQWFWPRLQLRLLGAVAGLPLQRRERDHVLLAKT